jgi:Zn-dependent peptidase ImmA (M78 family)
MTRISDAVRELLEATNQISAPVDVTKIANYLGLVLVKADMADDVSGMLIREDSSSTVGINKSHHPNRQRFTLAHEIGHHQLHRGRPLIVDSPVRINLRDRTSGMATDREEMEANRFAAELLMPSDLVLDEVAASPPESIDDLKEFLAAKFKVSPEAMGYRLVNLGIVS